MVIVALPEDTVRLLNSSAVITTPIDLVKELLDNALDAKSTFVDILVAPNLVDKIEVRDNGHGISEEDYDSLGRPGHTSKISSFEQVSNIGGTTLGFRGQALASANTMGTVSVTTRTMEDPTAILLNLKTGIGGVDSKHRISAPVGTAVSVTGLYKNFPVRSRTAIKEAPKYMSRIKLLLQEYALARPGIRLSFKSIGDQAKWSYSPRPQATIREAVIQLLGTDVMSQCMIRTTCDTQAEEADEATQDDQQISIQAVLPSIDGDLSKISKRAFFAVDSRPLTTFRGTMKTLLKIFKSHMSRALHEMGGRDCPRDPFICVNIKCPPGTYDPNIEASKNEVLFSSEARLVELFERLCTEIYRIQPYPDAFVTLEKRRLGRNIQTQTPPLSSDGPDEGFRPDSEISSSESFHGHHPRNQAAFIPAEINTSNTSQSEGPIGPYRRSSEQPAATMSDFGRTQSHHRRTIQVRPHGRPKPEQEDLEGSASTDIRNIRANLHNMNPGVGITIPAAAAHNSLYDRSLGNAPRFNDQSDVDLDSDDEAERLAARFRGQPDVRSRGHDSGRPVKPTVPQAMPQKVGLIQQAAGGELASGGNMRDTMRPQSPQVDQALKEPFDDLAILRPYSGRFFNNLRPANPEEVETTYNVQQPPLPMFTSASTLEHSLDANAALHVMQQVQPQPRSDGRNALPTFRSEYDTTKGGIGPDGFRQTTISFGGSNSSRQPRPQQRSLHIDDIPSKPNPPYRKPWKGNKSGSKSRLSQKLISTQDDATYQADVSQADSMELNERRSLGHVHSAPLVTGALRRSAERPHETSVTTSPSPIDTGDSDFEVDSRKYLMRRQRSEADHQRRGRPMLAKAKSDMLPLERVPNTCEMQRLVLVMAPNVEKLGDGDRNSAEDYVLGGGYSTETKLGEDLSLEDAAQIETRMRTLWGEWTETTLGQRIDVEINIGALLKGKNAVASG